MRPVATPEQEELRLAVRAFCAREVTPERLRAWADGPDAAQVRLAEEVARLGWLGLGLPTSVGGSAASLVDVALLVSEAARGLLPRSVIGAIERATAVAVVAPGTRVLASLASGDNSVAHAIDEEGGRSPVGWGTVLRTCDGVDAVFGTKAYVCDAKRSELHLVAALADGVPRLVLVEAGGEGVRAEELRSFGGDSQAHVHYDGAPVVEVVAEGEGALGRLGCVSQALALAEMLGGMEAVLEASVGYVKEREQFGQKIALFQAVRHQIADMGMRTTAARHLVWQAITRVAAGTLRGTELPTALAYTGRAFRDVCFAGHHLHGGAGYVVEHPLHLHSERAQSLAIRYAPEAPALAEVAGALLD